ncbi:MAG: 7-cyano-7-deazaguanine synthase QueC [Duodenibacillus sp.]|nr:7-cyano-7-deazaguanine synthase QueC [Duodenibacillus sp.]HBC68977.1 7-cyano-7-deazaguanine synthase QueC [Sutterella sp.]
MTQNPNKALIVFSGGQDSTTCLAWALKHYDEVHTIGFTYGQVHTVEMQCRKRILASIEALLNTSTLRSDRVLPLTALAALDESALTRGGEFEINEENGLPTSFVPGRNLIFFTVAAAHAYNIGADTIISGVGEADYSGYPDCREATLAALENAISLGLDRKIALLRPLMHRTKEQTWELAYETGGMPLVEFIARESHTCYHGDRTELHPWGYGCGRCPACVLRKAGFEKFLALCGEKRLS